MTIMVGLTGSIGMGKSTTAKLFADAGCDVWDADAAVHRLYAQGGAAVRPLQSVFPSAVVDGAVDRDALKQIIASDKTALAQIEAIVHPLVGQDRATFLETSASDIVVLDIPLLFETGGDDRVDVTVCVHVDAKTQRDRVLARGTMSEDQFSMILSKQLRSEEKCGRADYCVETDTLDHAKAQVTAILESLRKEHTDA